MAKKQTIGNVYKEILAAVPMSGKWQEPLTLNDVYVLSAKFAADRYEHRFHYDLLLQNVDYLLYDARLNGRVNVIFRKEVADIAKAEKLVEQNNGYLCQFYANDTI